MNKLPLAKTEHIVVQELGKELLIYDLQAHKAYNLNETSSIVYNACDGKTTFEELKIKTKFSDDLIFLALDKLKEENLLEENQQFYSPFIGLSRREVIRKIGFASMVALPVISSLVAPTAVMAQSASASACPTAGTQFCAGSAADCATNGPGNCGSASCTAALGTPNATCTALGNVTCTCA